MSTIKNGQSSLYCYFNKIITGPGTNFQSPALSQKHVRNICHTAYQYLTKFHFDRTQDSKEISICVTSIMQQCLTFLGKFQNHHSQEGGSYPPPPLPFLGQTPFSKISPFLEIQDIPTYYRPIRKTKVLNDAFNQFIYNFYPQNILILE